MAEDPRQNGERCVVLVGPMGSGKSSLLDSLLHSAGALPRRGTLKPLDSGRFEPVIVSTQAFGQSWNFVDTVGAVEAAAQAQALAMLADLVLVVIEPVLERLPAVEPMLRFLDRYRIPHVIFVNKMDHGAPSLRAIIDTLQPESPRPLLLRQVPIRDGDAITGYVDVISERAYRYHAGQASDRVPMPDTVKARETEARTGLLETLADFDDHLLEQLLEDVPPSTAEVYDQLRRDIAGDLVVPVMFGAATLDEGVRRLWKCLRHDTPTPTTTDGRLGLESEGGTVLQLARSAVLPHTGRVMLGRVWRGRAEEGQTLSGQRLGGLLRSGIGGLEKLPQAETGAVVLVTRLDGVRAGQVLAASDPAPALPFPAAPAPVHGLAIAAENRTDDVKLAAALPRLLDGDPSLSLVHDLETGETILAGQGELHVRDALDRLHRLSGVAIHAQPPAVPYRETIRAGTRQHTRHKRQTGGHGQFADIVLEIAPLPRGSGLVFSDKIVGGVVPRNFIPAVEDGVRDALAKGPLGHPVVDLAVTLVDGSHHSVDSSEMAFRTAAQIAIREALPNCQPVLLEPIQRVSLTCPTDATARVQRIVTGRRGQLLGYDGDGDRPGWDRIEAQMPLADMGDLIVELRSATLGLGHYWHDFDHLAETRAKSAA